MASHPLPAASERGATPEEFAAHVADEVVFHRPILVRPLMGKRAVLHVLANAATVTGPPAFRGEFRGGDRTALVWGGHVDGQPVEAVMVVVDDTGRAREFAVWMRPYPAVTLFRDEMRRRTPPGLTTDAHWTIAGGFTYEPHEVRAYRDEGADLRLAADATLHPPHAAHGPHRHYAELTAGYRALRFWGGCVAGHALEAVDLLTFRPTGEVAEATEYLRPWPVVALFEQALRAPGEG